MNNVLIIEDDKEICVMIKDHLEKYNYQVFFTLTGANAIERIKELSPDLIILDLLESKLNTSNFSVMPDKNTGIVTGIFCLYVFSGASVYLMLWSDMETVSIPLKFFVYGNPMYYWMNFSSCRTMGIIEHLPFYFIGCISLLIVGGLIMIRKEIK